MVELPNRDNPNVCREHGVMMHSSDDSRRICPVCEADEDIEVRLDTEHSIDVNGTDISMRIDGELMSDLIDTVVPYISEEFDDDGVWITVYGIEDDKLPAGYTKAQEKWINVIEFESGAIIKRIARRNNATETIENLNEEGY